MFRIRYTTVGAGFQPALAVASLVDSLGRVENPSLHVFGESIKPQEFGFLWFRFDCAYDIIRKNTEG